MKKIAVFLTFLFLSTGLFANDYNSYQILDVNTDNIYEVFDDLEAGEDYSFNFSEDFDFSELDEGFFQYRMIEKLHDLCVAGSRLKFSGPFDYIYFDGYQSVNNFSVIKTQIIEHPEKYYCVDISESNYDTDSYGEYIPLPVNCFAGHDNLYWVYFGKFLGEDIPNGVCSNLKNLQAVFFWDEGNVASGAFNNSNPDALYVCGDCGLVLPLSEYVEDYDFSDYDYLKFTSAYEYDPYSGVSWLVDGEEDCYYGWWEQDWLEDNEKIGTTEPSYNNDSAEDYNSFPLIKDDDEEDYDYDEEEDYDYDEMGYINYLTADIIEELEWEDLGEDFEIIEVSRAKVEKKTETAFATAKKFITLYAKGDSAYKKLAVLQDDGKVLEEGFQTGIKTFADYGKVINIYLYTNEGTYDTEDGSQIEIMAGLEYEKDGEIKKDATIIYLDEVDGVWKVEEVYNGVLSISIFQIMIYSMY